MRCKNKKYKAQMVVEFALVVPILILILFAIAELGYAIMIRNMVISATRYSTTKINKTFSEGGTLAAKEAAIAAMANADIIQTLQESHVPTTGKVSVKVMHDVSSNYYVVSTYTYRPILMTFMGSLGGGIGDINMSSVQIIKKTLLQSNNTTISYTNADLEAFFPDQTGVGGQNGTDGALRGNIAENMAIRDSIAILVKNPYERAGNPQFYRLFSWYGSDLLPANVFIWQDTATLVVVVPDNAAVGTCGGPEPFSCFTDNMIDTGIPFIWIATALGKTQILYTQFNSGTGNNGGRFATLNACDDQTNHDNPWPATYWNSCPFQAKDSAASSTHYPRALYKIDSRASGFFENFGYRWCDAPGMPACNADLYPNTALGDQTINEMALKGITRTGWWNSADATDFVYNTNSSYERVKNIGAQDLTGMCHYTTGYPNYTNFDTTQIVNITMPCIPYYGNPVNQSLLENPAGPFYTSKIDGPIYLDANGYYAPSCAAPAPPACNIHLITEFYIDSDSDGIPDAYDLDPWHFDGNLNGVLDGHDNAAQWVVDNILYPENNPGTPLGIPFVPWIGSPSPMLPTLILGVFSWWGFSDLGFCGTVPGYGAFCSAQYQSPLNIYKSTIAFDGLNNAHFPNTFNPPYQYNPNYVGTWDIFDLLGLPVGPAWQRAKFTTGTCVPPITVSPGVGYWRSTTAQPTLGWTYDFSVPVTLSANEPHEFIPAARDNSRYFVWPEDIGGQPQPALFQISDGGIMPGGFVHNFYLTRSAPRILTYENPWIQLDAGATEGDVISFVNGSFCIAGNLSTGLCIFPSPESYSLIASPFTSPFSSLFRITRTN